MPGFFCSRIPAWFDWLWLAWCLGVVAYALHQIGWALGLWRDHVHGSARLVRR